MERAPEPLGVDGSRGSRPRSLASLSRRERERWAEERLRPDERTRRTYLYIACGYGVTCFVGAVAPLAGLVLVALIGAAAALRALVRTPWLVVVLGAMTVAQIWVPWLAVVIGVATILFLVYRVLFVVAHLRVVILGTIAYAVLLAGVLAAGPGSQALARLASLPLDGEPARWVGALVLGLGGGLFMAIALRLARGDGYTTWKSVEIMALVPALVLGSIAPFVDHDAALAAWHEGRLPDPAKDLRVPPSLADAIANVRRVVGMP